MHGISHGKKANGIGRLKSGRAIEPFIEDELRPALQFELEIVGLVTLNRLVETLGQKRSIERRYAGNVNAAAEENAGAKRLRILVSKLQALDRKPEHNGTEFRAIPIDDF